MSREDLLAMGFDTQDIDAAISHTDGSIEQCIDWISAHQDGTTAQTSSTTEAASASGHTNELSLEERLRVRKEAAAKKRAELEKKQRIDRLEIGKRQVEADRVRQEMQVEQAKKDAAARKREAQEDRQYKEKLRKKIAQDRMEREAKERERQREKATSEGAPETSDGQVQAAPQSSSQATLSKPAPSTIRMRIKHNAKTVTKCVEPTLTVEDLGEQLAPEFELAPGSFELESAYPRATIQIVANTNTVHEQGLSNASLTIKLI